MKRVRDVIAHVAGRMGQDDNHVVAGGGRRSQLISLRLNEGGQPVSAELELCLGHAWGHLTWGAERAAAPEESCGTFTFTSKCLFSPCLMRWGWVWGLGWPRYRAGSFLGFKPPGLTEMCLDGHQLHPAVQMKPETTLWKNILIS